MSLMNIIIFLFYNLNTHELLILLWINISIQTFWAMNVLCADKTGTSTEDHVVLQKIIMLCQMKIIMLYSNVIQTIINK